jgi:hypothetical protein
MAIVEFRFIFYFYQLVLREENVFKSIEYTNIKNVTRKRLLFYTYEYQLDTLNYRNLIILILEIFCNHKSFESICTSLRIV